MIFVGFVLKWVGIWVIFVGNVVKWVANPGGWEGWEAGKCGKGWERVGNRWESGKMGEKGENE